MGKTAQAQKSGVSPYKRYGKVPYHYTHKRCEHNHTHKERHLIQGRTYEWQCCNACNVIVQGPFEK